MNADQAAGVGDIDPMTGEEMQQCDGCAQVATLYHNEAHGLAYCMKCDQMQAEGRLEPFLQIGDRVHCEGSSAIEGIVIRIDTEGHHVLWLPVETCEQSDDLVRVTA